MSEKSCYVLVTILVIILLIIVLLPLINPKTTRYNKLLNSDTKPFINEYKNIKKCTNDKVVVSFSSTPKRIKNITPMLNSLLNQTTRVNQFALNVSEDCEVPEEYKDLCNVFITGKDYGTGTKYVPTLLREDECGTKIILVDDDYIYGEDLIEKILKESEKNPNKCLYVGDDFESAKTILLKPEFISKVNHSKCDNKWLKDNLNVDVLKIPYDKNIKYIR